MDPKGDLRESAKISGGVCSRILEARVGIELEAFTRRLSRVPKS